VQAFLGHGRLRFGWRECLATLGVSSTLLAYRRASVDVFEASLLPHPPRDDEACPRRAELARLKRVVRAARVGA
jgi:hypothetical protein